jgi:hypothetical protein
MQSYFTYGVVDLSWADERIGTASVGSASIERCNRILLRGLMKEQAFTM